MMSLSFTSWADVIDPMIQEPLRILKKQMLRFWEICEAFDGPTVMENAEVFDHQERAQTEEVQDMEKGVSDKEDNVDVDDQGGSAYDP
jgi:hypothetical protein